MNHFQTEERILMGTKVHAVLCSSAPLPWPGSEARETARPETRPPYVVELELPCDECGGSGFDPGDINPWGPEPCPACRGAGTRKITKNYLAEALRIAGNAECLVPVERAHLVAIVQYCRPGSQCGDGFTRST